MLMSKSIEELKENASEKLEQFIKEEGIGIYYDWEELYKAQLESVRKGSLEEGIQTGIKAGIEQDIQAGFSNKNTSFSKI